MEGFSSIKGTISSEIVLDSGSHGSSHGGSLVEPQVKSGGVGEGISGRIHNSVKSGDEVLQSKSWVRWRVEGSHRRNVRNFNSVGKFQIADFVGTNESRVIIQREFGTNRVLHVKVVGLDIRGLLTINEGGHLEGKLVIGCKGDADGNGAIVEVRAESRVASIEGIMDFSIGLG